MNKAGHKKHRIQSMDNAVDAAHVDIKQGAEEVDLFTVVYCGVGKEHCIGIVKRLFEVKCTVFQEEK